MSMTFPGGLETTKGTKSMDIFKWLWTRNRINRRLRSAHTGWWARTWLSALLLVCVAGCNIPPVRTPLFKDNQIVDFHIGNLNGQIVAISPRRDSVWYLIRIERANEPIWFRESELVAP